MTSTTLTRKRAPKLVAVSGPPPFRRGRKPAQVKVPTSPIARWLLAMRKNPGQWYVYPDRVYSSIVSNIANGKAYGFKAGEYETAGRDGKKVSGTSKQKYVMYARYVGK